MIQKQGKVLYMTGRIVKDVEAKQAGEKKTYRASFGIGTDAGVITNVVAWRDKAEYAGTLRKGDEVFAIAVEGESRTYNDKQYRDNTIEFIIKQPKAGREPGEEAPHDMPPKRRDFDQMADMKEIDEDMPF